MVHACRNMQSVPGMPGDPTAQAISLFFTVCCDSSCRNRAVAGFLARCLLRYAKRVCCALRSVQARHALSVESTPV